MLQALYSRGGRIVKKFLLLLIIVVLLCGCSEEEKAPTWESYTNLRLKVKKETFIQDENLKKPGALFAAENLLYIIDIDNSCVCCYNYDGELVNCFGKIGSGKGEFDAPAAITMDEQYIYVADEKDGRIQFFDFDGNYQKEVYIEELDDISVRVLDIESDGTNLYVSAGSMEKKRLGVYLIDQNENIKKIGKTEIGCFGKNEKTNEIFFANAYEYFEKDDMFGYQGGESFLAGIKDNKLQKMFLLPEGYLPAELYIEDDKIYIFSEALMEVDVFDYSGNYIETLFAEVAEMGNRGVSCMAVRDNVIYLSDTENSLIYKVELTE